MTISLIVHGGAWEIPDAEVAEHREGVERGIAAGWAVLEAGGSALDAVEAAVRVLEDAPIFDAGTGSVLNSDGNIEMDAAIMDGQTLRSGGVAAISRIKNPISLARHVLDSDVVLLVGQGAERFAEGLGIPRCQAEELIVERERIRWAKIKASGARTQDAFMGQPHDTVGAVALDQHGNIAAATSTGGTPNKMPGRVGDSPLIGAGLYADNLTGGGSSTGWGESIIKVLLAKTATDAIDRFGDPMIAARHAVELLHRRVGGYGGIILLGSDGKPGFAFNTPRMAYGYRVQGGETVVGIDPVV